MSELPPMNDADITDFITRFGLTKDDPSYKLLAASQISSGTGDKKVESDVELTEDASS
jgi:hypothetical protein